MLTPACAASFSWFWLQQGAFHLPAPQPVLPTVLLGACFQAREASLEARQRCRNHGAAAGTMSQERQG